MKNKLPRTSKIFLVLLSVALLLTSASFGLMAKEKPLRGRPILRLDFMQRSAVDILVGQTKSGETALIITRQVLDKGGLVHVGLWMEGFGNRYLFGTSKVPLPDPLILGLLCGSAILQKTPSPEVINHNTSRSNNSDVEILYDPNEDEPGDPLGSIEREMMSRIKKAPALDISPGVIAEAIPNINKESILKSMETKFAPLLRTDGKRFFLAQEPTNVATHFCEDMTYMSELCLPMSAIAAGFNSMGVPDVICKLIPLLSIPQL